MEDKEELCENEDLPTNSEENEADVSLRLIYLELFFIIYTGCS